MIQHTEARNWGRKFLNILEANIVKPLIITEHSLFESTVIVGEVDKIKITIELFKATHNANRHNPYTGLSSTDIVDIEALNLSAITIARIFAHNGVYKAIVGNRENELLYFEGVIPEIKSVHYNVTIKEVVNGLA